MQMPFVSNWSKPVDLCRVANVCKQIGLFSRVYQMFPFLETLNYNIDTRTM